jgi:hypothetical protein
MAEDLEDLSDGNEARPTDELGEGEVSTAAAGALLRRAVGGAFAGASRTCDECGEVSAFHAHDVYRSHGLIIRCPRCDAVAGVVVEQPGRFIVRLAGLWRIPERPRQIADE